MITSTETTLLYSIVDRLRMIEGSRTSWERVFDVHDRFLSPQISDIVVTEESDFARIERGLDDATGSHRMWMDAVVASACWLFLNACDSTRSSLLHTIKPWGGIVTLLANMSGRFRDQYMQSGDIRWAKYALSAISLLGDNYDPREDRRLVDSIRQTMVRIGADHGTVFHEMARKANSRLGQEYDLMARDSVLPTEF